jgi:hypothetical protein
LAAIVAGRCGIEHVEPPADDRDPAREEQVDQRRAGEPGTDAGLGNDQPARVVVGQQEQIVPQRQHADDSNPCGWRRAARVVPPKGPHRAWRFARLLRVGAQTKRR